MKAHTDRRQFLKHLIKRGPKEAAEAKADSQAAPESDMEASEMRAAFKTQFTAMGEDQMTTFLGALGDRGEAQDAWTAKRDKKRGRSRAKRRDYD